MYFDVSVRCLTPIYHCGTNANDLYKTQLCFLIFLSQGSVSSEKFIAVSINSYMADKYFVKSLGLKLTNPVTSTERYF